MTPLPYDVVIVGGGIHGAGVAQAAAAAGYSVLLLEKDRPAAGTSSRSSKLIHGGLRYLESAQFSLVRESLREREILLKNAPGLVRLIAFYIPIYRQTTRRPWQIRAGLFLYSLLGGFSRNTRFQSVPQRNWDQFNGLRSDDLQKVFRYYDAQTDDAALTRAVLESAISFGAKSLYPARFLAGEKTDAGYMVRYRHGSEEQQCTAAVLINAAGPWINEVRSKVEPSPPGMEIDLVQGAHIVLDRPVCSGVVYVESPQDRRAVFIMPWQDRALVGTTETVFTGPPDEATPLPKEVEYLEATLQHYFPACEFKTMGQFAGLRVLPSAKGSPFGRPRETTLISDGRQSPHYLAIYGGKLTGYRATAEKVLRLLRRSLPKRKAIAKTDDVRIS